VTSERERFRGALLEDMIGRGAFNLRPGDWTDDMSMALCLARSLVETGRFDAREQMQSYVRWWREGYLSSTGRYFDIGNTVAGVHLIRRAIATSETFVDVIRERRSGASGGLDAPENELQRDLVRACARRAT